MKKLLKVFAIAMGVLIALVAVLVVVALVVIDPNKYRDDIVSLVKNQTGRDLKIEGDLKLSFFPWLGLETGGLELSNAPGFAPPFARVDAAAVRVELLPLLRQQVRVDGIRLDGLKLHLARAADGRTNWDDLATKKPQAPSAPKEPGTNPAAALAAFSVNRLEVTNAEFTWRDQVAGASYALRRVDLTSGNLLGDAPAPLRLAFDVESGKPAIRKRVQLDAQLHLNPATEALDVPQLALAIGELRVRGQARGTKVLSAPAVSGQVEVPAFAPRPLLQELGIPYIPADAKALNKVGLRTRFDYSGQGVALSDLVLTLDETTVNGGLKLTQQPHTAYRLNLGIDTLDIDRYLLAPAKGAKAPAAQPAPAAAAVIPLALLRDTDASGQIRIEQLKAFGIRSQSVAINLTARDGRITLGPNTAKLYGGNYAGRTVADVSGKTPRFQFEEKLTGVNIGPFLKDAGVFERYSGSGNVELKLTAQGFDAGQIKRTLNGTTAVQLQDGKIEGVNLQKLIQDARQQYDKVRGKETQPTTQPSDATAFKSLTATIRVTDGVARNDDFKLDGPVVRAQGSGTADLAKETIDYRLPVTLAEGSERSGTTVPVRITGTFQKPIFSVDVSALFKEQVQQKLEQRLDKKLDERLDKFRKRIR